MPFSSALLLVQECEPRVGILRKVKEGLEIKLRSLWKACLYQFHKTSLHTRRPPEVTLLGFPSKACSPIPCVDWIFEPARLPRLCIVMNLYGNIARYASGLEINHFLPLEKPASLFDHHNTCFQMPRPSDLDQEASCHPLVLYPSPVSPPETILPSAGVKGAFKEIRLGCRVQRVVNILWRDLCRIGH